MTTSTQPVNLSQATRERLAIRASAQSSTMLTALAASLIVGGIAAGALVMTYMANHPEYMIGSTSSAEVEQHQPGH